MPLTIKTEAQQMSALEHKAEDISRISLGLYLLDG